MRFELDGTSFVVGAVVTGADNQPKITVGVKDQSAPALTMSPDVARRLGGMLSTVADVTEYTTPSEYLPGGGA